MSTSYAKIKQLSDAHPELTKKWRAKHGKSGYPPLKYWAKKGYYTPPVRVPRVTKAKKMGGDPLVIKRLKAEGRANTRRENIYGEGVTKEQILHAKEISKTHPHNYHHIEGKEARDLMIRRAGIKYRAAKAKAEKKQIKIGK